MALDINIFLIAAQTLSFGASSSETVQVPRVVVARIGNENLPSRYRAFALRYHQEGFPFLPQSALLTQQAVQWSY
jgi:hypothetical protein